MTQAPHPGPVTANSQFPVTIDAALTATSRRVVSAVALSLIVMVGSCWQMNARAYRRQSASTINRAEKRADSIREGGERRSSPDRMNEKRSLFIRRSRAVIARIRFENLSLRYHSMQTRALCFVPWRYHRCLRNPVGADDVKPKVPWGFSNPVLFHLQRSTFTLTIKIYRLRCISGLLGANRIVNPW